MKGEAMADFWATLPICCHCNQILNGDSLTLSVEMGRCALCNGDVTITNEPISEGMKVYLNLGGDSSWYCHMDRTNAERADYLRGLMNGFQSYAWWKDGVQYVGSCGTRLMSALKTISDELDRLGRVVVGGDR